MRSTEFLANPCDLSLIRLRVCPTVARAADAGSEHLTAGGAGGGRAPEPGGDDGALRLTAGRGARLIIAASLPWSGTVRGAVRSLRSREESL